MLAVLRWGAALICLLGALAAVDASRGGLWVSHLALVALDEHVAARAVRRAGAAASDDPERALRLADAGLRRYGDAQRGDRRFFDRRALLATRVEALLALGRGAQAVEASGRWVDEDAKDVTAAVLHGRALAETAPDEATAWFEALVERYPDLTPVVVAAAAEHRRQGRLDQARAAEQGWYDALVLRNPRSRAWLELHTADPRVSDDHRRDEVELGFLDHRAGRRSFDVGADLRGEVGWLVLRVEQEHLFGPEAVPLALEASALRVDGRGGSPAVTAPTPTGPFVIPIGVGERLVGTLDLLVDRDAPVAP